MTGPDIQRIPVPIGGSQTPARPEGDGIHWTDTVHCGRIFCIRCGVPRRLRISEAFSVE